MAKSRERKVMELRIEQKTAEAERLRDDAQAMMLEAQALDERVAEYETDLAEAKLMSTVTGDDEPDDDEQDEPDEEGGATYV